MPFAEYTDFADCVAKNQHKEDPEAYCAVIKAKTEDRTKREHRIIHRAFTPTAVETDNLPAGVCGRVRGIGLVYDQEDSFKTTWAPGCLDMTKRSKVAAGKVQLFTAGSNGHDYGVRSHVGVVRSTDTQGNEEWVSADLFDTEDGRRTKEYLNAVLQARGNTGFSIGCYLRRTDPKNESRFTEVELEEFTITPRPAVPGAEIASVRHDPAAMWTLLDSMLNVLPLDQVHARVTARLSGHANDPGLTAEAAASSTAPASETQSADSLATEADRARALASLYGN